MLTNMDDPTKDYDEMWYGHASQLMSVRGLDSQRAAVSSLALLRLVFAGKPDFDEWLATRPPIMPKAASAATPPAKTQSPGR